MGQDALDQAALEEMGQDALEQGALEETCTLVPNSTLSAHSTPNMRE